MDALAMIVTGLVPVVVGSLATYRLSTEHARREANRTVRAEAATALSAPIRDLRRTIRNWGPMDVEPATVASASVAWADAFETHGHRLPHGWRHVGRSVRAAAGEVFGGVVMADLRPELATFRLEMPDSRWQEAADEYLSYVLKVVGRWGDRPHDVRVLRDFDDWLRYTGRRLGAGQNSRR